MVRFLSLGLLSLALLVVLQSAPSRRASAQGPPSALPAAPSEFRALVEGETAVRLTWKDNATAETGYELWRCRSNCAQASNWTLAGRVPADTTSFADPGLSPGRYTYGLWAYNSSGYSEAAYGVSAALASCGSGSTFFSVFPVATSEYVGIIPLGNLDPESGHVFPTDHTYIVTPMRDSGARREVAVSSPGEVWVTTILSREYLTEGITDFEVHFSPCDEVNAYFIHLNTLAPKLQGSLSAPADLCWEETPGPYQYRNCVRRELYVPLRAGEPMGTAPPRQL